MRAPSTPHTPRISPALLLPFTLQPLLGLGYQIFAERAGRALTDTPFGAAWLARLAVTPWTWAAIAFDIAALACWIYILSEMPLGFAFALTSFSYVLVMAASVILFHETLHPLQFAGGGLILSGLFLVSVGREDVSDTVDRSAP